VATDDINVFGSLRNFIADQSMQAVERDRQKLEAIQAAKEQFMPTPAQSAYIGTIFAPGSGIVDASGAFPEFPSADVPVSGYLSGEPMPSMAENIAAGGIDRYLFAPLQGLGVAGDALYAAPVVGPVLGATIGTGLKGIGALGPVLKVAAKSDKKGIKALRNKQIQEDVNTFARDSEGFVSPSLEALISKAPANLKGKQITEWLSANANKGVKPKELEFLGVDEFIANNPNASVREVAEGVSQNKVEVGKNVYRGSSYGQANIEFEVTTPKLDPLDPDLLNYQYRIDDIKYDLENMSPADENLQESLVDHFNTLRVEKFNETGSEKGIPDKIYEFDEITGDKLEQLGLGKGSNKALDDLIENYAEAEYMSNPYELVQPTQTQGIEGPLEGTFAFGNDDVGYSIFINGERATVDTPYSRSEAQIVLQNKLQDENLLDIVEEGVRYKNFVDESLPGGNNYREIVYTWKNAPVEHDVQDHFDELSQISHALVRDRKLADGSFSLHVDELQSDLHTQGKQVGYRLPDAEFNRIKQEIDPLLEGTSFTFLRHAADDQPGLAYTREGDIDGFLDLQQFDMYATASPEKRKEMFVLDPKYDVNKYKYDGNRGKQLLAELGGSKEKFDKFVETVRPLIDEGQTPNYPFKGDDWYKMSLKQLLKDAVEEGKDTISVSSSAPMIARYSTKYEKFYKSLYDQKIPSEMKKLANKYGGKFEKGGRLDIKDTFGKVDPDYMIQGERYYDVDAETLNNLPLTEANIIRITPEMKQKILEEGLSSFALGGPVGNFIAPDDINIFA